MENMDKGLTVLTKMGVYQSTESTLNDQSTKFCDFDERRPHWASVVRDMYLGKIMWLAGTRLLCNSGLGIIFIVCRASVSGQFYQSLSYT